MTYQRGTVRVFRREAQEQEPVKALGGSLPARGSYWPCSNTLNLGAAKPRETALEAAARRFFAIKH